MVPYQSRTWHEVNLAIQTDLTQACNQLQPLEVA